jgi:hypothetical protein
MTAEEMIAVVVMTAAEEEIAETIVAEVVTAVAVIVGMIAVMIAVATNIFHFY